MLVQMHVGVLNKVVHSIVEQPNAKKFPFVEIAIYLIILSMY